MSELTSWESVQHVKLTPELEKLVDAGDTFTSWPGFNRAHAKQSFTQGVKLGHVAEGFEAAIVGTVSYVQSDVLELRARWEPPKDEAAA